MILHVEESNDENLEQEMRDIAARLELSDYREALYFPKYFQIETTRLCNARCTFCAIDQWSKETTFMSDALFEKVATELGQYKHWVKMVNLNRTGEPLVDKKIIDRVARVCELGMKMVSISTNASLLTPEKIRGLIEAGLHEMWISIDSVYQEVYEAQRIGLSYEQVMENIRTVFRLRDELKSSMLIRMRGVCLYDLDSPEGKRELAGWEDYWKKYQGPRDRIYMKRPHNWGNQIDLKERIQEEHANGLTYHPCIVPWSTLHVTAMGKVPLCGQDFDALMNVGDVHQQTIAEIWKGPVWTRIREQHQSGRRNEINFCQGCKLWDLDFKLEKQTAKPPKLHSIDVIRLKKTG